MSLVLRGGRKIPWYSGRNSIPATNSPLLRTQYRTVARTSLPLKVTASGDCTGMEWLTRIRAPDAERSCIIPAPFRAAPEASCHLRSTLSSMVHRASKRRSRIKYGSALGVQEFRGFEGRARIFGTTTALALGQLSGDGRIPGPFAY